MPRSRTPDPAPTAAVVPPAGTNLVVVRGTLTRDPEERTLPSGDRLVAYEVTVRPEADAGPAPKAESVPVAWFDPPRSAAGLKAGDEVVVVGRVRRRFFRAGGSTASRTEVVATRIVPAGARARVRAALGPVVGSLGAG